MLDIQLRPAKDRVIDLLYQYIPASIILLHITGIGSCCGLLSVYQASKGLTTLALLFWLLSRLLDCFDGALARYRKTASDLGGFLDLLANFII